MAWYVSYDLSSYTYIKIMYRSQWESAIGTVVCKSLCQQKRSCISTLTNYNHHKWHHLNSDWSSSHFQVVFVDKWLANHSTKLCTGCSYVLAEISSECPSLCRWFLRTHCCSLQSAVVATHLVTSLLWWVYLITAAGDWHGVNWMCLSS